MRSFGITHTGHTREINEDSFFISEKPIGCLPNLFLVADGMGGHNAGEVASSMAVESFIKLCNTCPSGSSIEEILIKASRYANNVIYEHSIQKREMSGMGTTLVACTISNGFLYAANIGDSRLYVLGDEIQQITVDHSYVEELIRAGSISRNESYNHPDKNKITRALGVDCEIDVDIFKLNIDKQRKALLCTDGLSNLVNSDKLFEILNETEVLESLGKRLIHNALQNGGTDNITALIIDLSGWNEVKL